MINYDFLRVVAPIVTILVAAFFIWGLRTAMLEKEKFSRAAAEASKHADPHLDELAKVQQQVHLTVAEALRDLEKIRAEFSMLYDGKEKAEEVQNLKDRVARLESGFSTAAVGSLFPPELPLTQAEIESLLDFSPKSDSFDDWLKVMEVEHQRSGARISHNDPMTVGEVIGRYTKNNVAVMRLEYDGGKNFPALAN